MQNKVTKLSDLLISAFQHNILPTGQDPKFLCCISLIT
jgi:hypothetical protein